jgi:hypothetical protein
MTKTKTQTQKNTKTKTKTTTKTTTKTYHVCLQAGKAMRRRSGRPAMPRESERQDKTRQKAKPRET